MDFEIQPAFFMLYPTASSTSVQSTSHPPRRYLAVRLVFCKSSTSPVKF